MVQMTISRSYQLYQAKHIMLIHQVYLLYISNDNFILGKQGFYHVYLLTYS